MKWSLLKSTKSPKWQDEQQKVAKSIRYIQKKIKKAHQKGKKVRPVGANFGIDLYDNQLYQEHCIYDDDGASPNNGGRCRHTYHPVKYISLEKFKFAPYVRNDTFRNKKILVCHPNNTLKECFEAAHTQAKCMLYGTPFYYKITIGGCIANGAIGGHVPSMNVASYVQRLWIVDGLGKTHVIEGLELEYFRSTFGYLGIIYKIELEIFEESFFTVQKISSDIPFQHNNHVSQFRVGERAVSVLDKDEDKNNGVEYIDIIFNPVDPKDIPTEEQQKRNTWSMKLQNIPKNAVFLFDGLVSMFYRSVYTGFFDIFLPKPDSVSNSYGLVQAFPSIPEFVLSHIRIPLECGIYMTEDKFEEAMAIICRYHKQWYLKNYPCINIVIRKVFTNTCCKLDATRASIVGHINDDNQVSYYDITETDLVDEDGDYVVKTVDTVISVDFGFYFDKRYKPELEEAIRELVSNNVVYGFHLGKFVNKDILNFMKDKFHTVYDPSHKMIELKRKYDPHHVFSTLNLDELFLYTPTYV